MIDEDGIRQRWERIGCKFDERGRRLWAAGEVQQAAPTDRDSFTAAGVLSGTQRSEYTKTNLLVQRARDRINMFCDEPAFADQSATGRRFIVCAHLPAGTKNNCAFCTRADRQRGHDIPVVFSTGATARPTVASHFMDTPMLAKSFDVKKLQQASLPLVQRLTVSLPAADRCHWRSSTRPCDRGW